MGISFSIIMQSYLDLYNGSRKDPEKKFIRAVNSFLNQKHKDNELIIVSDDCDITEKLYLENFKDIKNIIYERVENKERKRMYDGEKETCFFRGYPRSVAQEIASKEVIGYMDSDDIILPNHLSNIESGWSIYDNNLFMSINVYEMLPVEIIDNSAYSTFNVKKELYPALISNGVLYNMKDYFGFDKIYCASSPNPLISEAPGVNLRSSTQCNFHRSSAKTRWRDTYGRSEDSIFSEELDKERTNTGGSYAVVNSPTYVFCHRHWPESRCVWDF